MYCDKRDGRTVHCGYVVGRRWFTAYAPVEKQCYAQSPASMSRQGISFAGHVRICDLLFEFVHGVLSRLSNQNSDVAKKLEHTSGISRYLLRISTPSRRVSTQFMIDHFDK